MERRILAEAHVARGHGAGVGAVAGDDRILERRAVIGNRAVVVGLRQLGEHIVVRVAAVGGFLPVVAEDVVRVRLHGDVRAVGLGDQFLHFIFGQGLFGFRNRRHTVDVVEGHVDGLDAGERFRRRDLRGHAFEVAVRHAGFRRDVRHPFIPDVGAGHDAVVGRGEVLAKFDCFAVDLDFGDVDEVAGEGRFAVRNADRHERNTGNFAVLNAGEVKGQGVGAGVLVSRYFGARDYSKMKTIVSTSLLSFLILSIFLGIFGFGFSNIMLSALQTPADILDDAVLYLRVYFVGFPFLFMYNILSTMFTSIGESKIPLGLLIFSSVLNIIMDLWMVAGLGLGVFGAALATLIAQGISAVFSLLIFLHRMRRYECSFNWFDRQELSSMLRIAVPSVLQQSTVSIGMMIVQAVVNPFGTQALAGYSATMRVENVFSLIFVSIGNAVSPYVSQNLGAKQSQRIKKGYHAALVLDVCFAVLAFVVIETLHTQISSLFLGKDGTDLAYQVSGDYMRWLGYFFIFMGIKMATDGVLRGLGIMRPFLTANMVNLAIRLLVALLCAPRFGIEYVWLAVPAGWFANFLISYVALRKSWPADDEINIDKDY